jgi:3-phenylpropionate/cinnamic acid dioxygenase small subunit
MADDDRARDLELIRRTIASYCQLCDDGRFDEWAGLYTPDATFTVMGATHEGPDSIKGFISAAQPPELRGKHVCANSLIDIEPDGATARARTDFVFVGRTDEGLAVTSAGRYHDTLVKHADRWLFASREIVFMGDE